MRHLFWFALIALVFAGIACSSKKDDAPSPRDGDEPTATAAGTTGAPATAAVTPGQCSLEAGNVVRTIRSGTATRSYRLHVPPSISAQTPLVLNFHGLGSRALEQEPYSQLLPLSDSKGFILVTPDGTGTPQSWASFSFASASVNDVAFTSALIDEMLATGCVDATRVYSTGLSNGGFMSSRLGCELDERIAAIAPVAGTHFPGSCGRAMPVLAFHGTADTVVPFEAGLILGSLPYPGVRAAIGQWAGHNGCDAGEGTTTRLSEHVTRIDRKGCEAPVSLVVVEDGGHTWPGAVDVPVLGRTTHEISAAELMWDFFADKRLQ